MFPRLARTMSRVLGTALFALVGMAAIAPGSAAASCGDYLIVGGHGPFGRSHAHAMPMGAASRFDLHSLATDSGDLPARRSPCHGPSCSNGSQPPAAPAPRVEVTLDHWLIASQAGAIKLPEAESWTAELSAKPRAGFAAERLRPPR